MSCADQEKKEERPAWIGHFPSKASWLLYEKWSLRAEARLRRKRGLPPYNSKPESDDGAG